MDVADFKSHVDETKGHSFLRRVAHAMGWVEAYKNKSRDAVLVWIVENAAAADESAITDVKVLCNGGTARVSWDVLAPFFGEEVTKTKKKTKKKAAGKVEAPVEEVKEAKVEEVKVEEAKGDSPKPARRRRRKVAEEVEAAPVKEVPAKVAPKEQSKAAIPEDYPLDDLTFRVDGLQKSVDKLSAAVESITEVLGGLHKGMSPQNDQLSEISTKLQDNTDLLQVALEFIGGQTDNIANGVFVLARDAAGIGSWEELAEMVPTDEE